VKAFAREDYEIERFSRQNRTFMDRMMDLFRLFATNLPVFMTVSAVGTLVVLWYGGTLVIQGSLTIGELIAFNAYLMMLMMPVRMLGFLVGMGARASASAQRILEILDTPVDIQDRADAAELPPIEGLVGFDQVSFRYHGGSDTLHDVSFQVQPGQVVALLGATGSGKSTIINLIPRFYDVSAGQVTIDGYDVRGVKVESLRRQVGIVLQNTALFSGTIRENIAYGCPEADEASLRAAAEAAEIAAFVESLPLKYETVVGERGATLSGGQRQRIAIARALLLNPKILIMDDSTSSVDVETEYQIQRALARLMAGRTSFVIAQRVSTVQNADLILVLDRGRIVARGTHDELLRDSPIYAELYQLQLGVDLADEEAGVRERGAQPAWPTSSVLEGRWL
jgi:ATP-binding cassette, subfamily B, multidrug efflux pump